MPHPQENPDFSVCNSPILNPCLFERKTRLGTAMVYTIKFMRHGRVMGDTPWGLGLNEAKEHALSHMRLYRADRVEVRDKGGVLVFQHPRTLKNG